MYLSYNDDEMLGDNDYNASWTLDKNEAIHISTGKHNNSSNHSEIVGKIEDKDCGMEYSYIPEGIDNRGVYNERNVKWDCSSNSADKLIFKDFEDKTNNDGEIIGEKGYVNHDLDFQKKWPPECYLGNKPYGNAQFKYCIMNFKSYLTKEDGTENTELINNHTIHFEHKDIEDWLSENQNSGKELPRLVLTKEEYKKGVYYFTNTNDKKSYLSFDAETKTFLSDDKKNRWKWRIVSKKEIPILDIKKNDEDTYLFKLSYNTLKQSFVITNKDSDKGYFYHKFEMDRKNILNFNIKKDESKLKFYQDGTLVFEMLDDSTEGNYDVSLPEYDENNFDNYLRNVNNNISNIKIFNIDNANKLDFLIYENKINDYFQPLGPNVKSEINPDTQKLTPKKINCKYEVVNNKIKRDNVQTNDLFSYKVGRITNNKKTDYVSCDIADFSIYTTNSPTPTIAKKIGEQLVRNENNALKSLYYPFVKTNKDTEKEIEEKNNLMKVMENKRIEILNNNDKLFSETKDTYKTNSNNYTDGGDNKGYNYKICMYRKNNVSIFSEAKPLVNEENYNTSPTLKPGI